MNGPASVATLVLLALIGASATYVLQRSSAPQIASEQRLLDSRQLLDVMPAALYDNQPLEQPLTLAEPVLRHSTLLGGY